MFDSDWSKYETLDSNLGELVVGPELSKKMVSPELSKDVVGPELSE